jgi:hypothetical protein
MAENIVAGLFGLTPEMYGEQQRRSALREGIDLAKLTPGEAGAAMTYAGARGLGGAIAGAMGIEDPQLKLISARNSIFQQIDQSDPESMLQGIKMLGQMGDQQGAMALAEYYRKAQGEMAQTEQRLAAGKASLAQAARERQQAVPADIQVANEIATLEDTLSQIEGLPANPERTRAKNLLNTRLAELRRLTAKGEKAVAANIKEVGVAETTREPVYLDVNNDQQFIYKQGADGKQVRVPFTGGVDRTTAKTSLGVKLPEGESEFVKQLGKEDAQELSKARGTSKAAAEELKSLQKLQELNQQQLVSGSFATNRVGVLNLLNTLGMTSGKDTQTLANSEQYSKVTGDLLLDKIKKLGTQPSSTDREFIAKILPQLENSAAARQELINYLANRASEVVLEVRAMDTYARKNRGLGGYVPSIPLAGQPLDVSTMSTEQLQKIARGQKP